MAFRSICEGRSTRFSARLIVQFILINMLVYAQTQVRRRLGHAGVQAGNQLVINGGMTIDEQKRLRLVHETLLIPLDQNWTTSTVNISSIPRNYPGLLHESLWYDELRETVYAFGGQMSADGGMDKTDPVHFPIEESRTPAVRALPVREGLTAWTNILGNDTTPRFPSTILGSTCGAYAFDQDRAYYIGAGISYWSTPAVNDWRLRVLNTPGILRFDFATQQIVNSTDDGGYFASRYSGPNETYLAPGSLFNAPFGPNGILVAIGGRTSSGSPDNQFGAGFENVFILDKQSNTSYYQTTTGDIPRSDFPLGGDITINPFCYFPAIDEELRTFDIFVYGRWSSSAETDTIYILSLPSFTWHKSDFNNYPRRTGMVCTAVSTNRQAIFVGGVNPEESPSSYPNASMDEWYNGISVFDMHYLKLTTYDAGAPPYSAPELVKKGYDDGNRYPLSWTSPDVKSIFTNWSHASKMKNTIPKSTIVGVTVAFGFVIITIIIIIIIVLRRWRVTSYRRWRLLSPSERSSFSAPRYQQQTPVEQ